MLAKKHRFHGRVSLGFVYKRGQVVRGPNMSLKFVQNSREPHFRLAVVVSRKVSKSAVIRNRIRRRLYEVVRDASPHLKQPYDLVVMVYSAEFALMPAQKLQAVVNDLLHRAQVLDKPPAKN